MLDSQEHIVETFELGLAMLEDVFENDHFAHSRVLEKFEPIKLDTDRSTVSTVLGSMDCNNEAGGEYLAFVPGSVNNFPPLVTWPRIRDSYLTFETRRVQNTAVAVVRLTQGDV